MDLLQRRALRKYQRDALYYTLSRNNSALFMEMRLGKSLIALRSLSIKFKNRDKKLIVGPYSAIYQWIKELHLEGLTDKDITLLIGKKKERKEKLKKDTEFYLINKEGWFYLQEIALINWSSLILDESTFIKDPSTKVSRFYIDNFEHVPVKMILTGMPAPESELNYFQQLKFIDKNILGIENYWFFRQQYFNQIFQNDYRLTSKGEKFLNERLSKNCFFLTRKDVNLDIEKIFSVRKINMLSAAWKVMQTLSREFIIEYENEVLDVTDAAGEVFHWLRGIFGGFLKDKFIFEHKTNELIDLLKNELAGKQVIVYAEYIKEIEMISKLLTKHKIKNDYIYGGNRERRFDILDSFTNGGLRVLVGQPVCFKHGVDLSCSDTIIYYSLPLSNETYGQSQDRIVNVSTKYPALIIALICEHTIEEEIYTSIMNKESREKLQKRIIKRLQETI